MKTFALSLLFIYANAYVYGSECVPSLPEPHANNAIAYFEKKGKLHLFSFMGLRSGKTHKNTSVQAYMFTEGNSNWTRLPDVPVKEGRLAASANAIKGKIYLFGGYTVAANGDEKSTPEVFRFDPKKKKYKRMEDMPTPVDDMVTFVYQDRYVYLVSGWHDEGNVRLVQVLDTKKNRWFQATEYPGTPVFGHAGGIVGNRFVIADGVAVVGKKDGKRVFDTVNEGWMGTIDSENPAKITYRRLPQLPGRGNYRMAGSGDIESNRVLFMGGTSTAYNYNGIGYDGTPAKATRHVFSWDFTKDKWVAHKDKPNPTMDHRGMFKYKGEWFTVGGLNSSRKVTGLINGMKTACPVVAGWER